MSTTSQPFAVASAGFGWMVLIAACVHLPPEVPDETGPAEGRLATAEGWLAGTVRGVSPGVPVVLVHGLGGTHHLFDPQLGALESHARVIAYDQRGCGESSLAPRKKYDLDTLARDLGAILDAARARKAVLVGHSFGADVVVQYAGAHPDRVAALVLIDPPGDLRRRTSTLSAELASRDDPSFWRDVDALTEPLLVGARTETRKVVLAGLHATPRDVLQRMLAGMVAFEPAVAVGDYAGPVSCLVTDRTSGSQGTTPPCRRVTRVPRVSHWPMLDAPEPVTRVIEESLPDRPDGVRAPDAGTPY